MSRIKILIPAYNAEKTIEKTLDSLVRQTFSDFKVFVVDNSSTDNTAKLVLDYKDERVHLIQNSTNLGNYGNFDKCISLADYEFTAIFHADDIYHENILDNQIRVMERSPDIGAVLTEANQIDEEDQIIGKMTVPRFVKWRSMFKDFILFDFDYLAKSLIRYHCFLVCPSALVRSEIYLNEVERTRPELFDTAADVDIWLRISTKWKVAVILKPLMNYRISKFQHSFAINKKRVERSDFMWIVNFYRHLGLPQDVRRIKVMDMIVRLSFLETNDRKFKRLHNVVLFNMIKIRNYYLAKWFKHVFIFIRTTLRSRRNFIK